MNNVHAVEFLGPIKVSQADWFREYKGKISHKQTITSKGEMLTAVKVHVFCNSLEDGPPIGRPLRAQSEEYCVAEIRFEDFHEHDGGWIFTAYNGG
ncbi:hypothetical protein [Caulobacter endophyticus]|uniref:hypothetical protein n=1 Tax=Caulobacter endophyticus TaxID=2172652 RepID=UPI00240F3A55|nr:hypothetical protein [Caulobacter endophyticus]MDG2530433.1 hypothetical protein [Caulobacter endophyticus]